MAHRPWQMADGAEDTGDVLSARAELEPEV